MNKTFVKRAVITTAKRLCIEVLEKDSLILTGEEIRELKDEELISNLSLEILEDASLIDVEKSMMFSEIEVKVRHELLELFVEDELGTIL